MNDLLQAAKAVIAEWDYYGNVYWEKIKTLRDAVERAEKQESKPRTKPIPTDFREWWETYALNKYGMGPAYHAWSAGQLAERERIKDVVAELLDPTDPWIHYSTLLEKIDDV